LEQERLTLISPNGAIDGVYTNAGEGTPLVIIANGHNGFFHYGMFPYIRKSLAEAGISTIGFNYSHSGIIGDADIFEDLNRYEKNCRRLEKEDLLLVLEETVEPEFENHSGRFILAHSMGGIATVFAANEAQGKHYAPDGIVLLCSLSTLNVRKPEVLEAWKENKVWKLRNNRTLQDLPQGEEYLNETLESVPGGKWDPEPVVRSLRMPVLVVHSAEDESVPVKHGENLYEWCKDNHPANAFLLIPGASHTLNTKHPFEGKTPQLELFLEEMIRWMNSLV